MYPRYLLSSQRFAVSLGCFQVVSRMLSSSLKPVRSLLYPRIGYPFTPSPTVSASLNALSMYHDTLLARAVESDQKHKPLLPPSFHSRFTRSWADNHTRYKWTARTLELIRFVELLLEMGLQRKVATRTRWRAIAALEVLK